MTAQPVQDIPEESGTEQVLRLRQSLRAEGRPPEEYNDYKVIAENLMAELHIQHRARSKIRSWVRSGAAVVIRAAEAAEHKPDTSGRGRSRQQDAARDRANGSATAHSQAGRQQPPRCAYDLLGVYIIEIGKRFGDFTMEDHERRFRSHHVRHEAHALSMRSHRWAQEQTLAFGVPTLYDIPRDKLESLIPEWLRP